MKNSYRLYGVFWDNKPITRRKLSVNIFDDEKNKDAVTLSGILKNEECSEEYLKEEKQYLFVDYLPYKRYKVVTDYFIRRLMQIAEYYKVRELLCVDVEKAELLEEMIDCYKREKHRMDCWRNQTMFFR